MSRELLHRDVCWLSITFLLSPTPLLPMVGPASFCHFVPFVTGLPEQPLAMATPNLDTHMVSPGTMCKPYPILVLLLSSQTNPAASPISTDSNDQQ